VVNDVAGHHQMRGLRGCRPPHAALPSGPSSMPPMLQDSMGRRCTGSHRQCLPMMAPMMPVTTKETTESTEQCERDPSMMMTAPCSPS